jgi:membrane peptidoglycan carboxypeptidase
MLDNNMITKTQYDNAIDEKIIIDSTMIQEMKDDSNDKVNNNNYMMTYAEYCTIKYLSEYYNIDKDEVSTMLANGNFKVTTSFNTEVENELQSAIDDTLSGSTIQDEDGYYILQGAGTIIDNSTGKVIAIVGGRTQDNVSTLYGINRAYQLYRQPGSSIKPLIVYTPALMKDIDPNTFASKVWESNNETASSIFTEIGYEYGISFLHDMNFSKIVDTDETLAAALGGLTYGVTTEEMASAYSCIANGGIYNTPTCLLSIKDE